MALRKHKGNYEAQLTLSSCAKVDLIWWIENVDKAFKIQFHMALRPLNLELMPQKRGGVRILRVTLPKVCGLFRKASYTSMS